MIPNYKPIHCWCLVIFLIFSWDYKPLLADLDGSTTPIYVDSFYTFSDGETATGQVYFLKGFRVPFGATVNFNVTVPVNGPIDLRRTGKLILGGGKLVCYGSPANFPNSPTPGPFQYGGFIDTADGSDIDIECHCNVTLNNTLTFLREGSLDMLNHTLSLEAGKGVTPAGADWTGNDYWTHGALCMQASADGSGNGRLFFIKNAQVIHATDHYRGYGPKLLASGNDVPGKEHTFAFQNSAIEFGDFGFMTDPLIGGIRYTDSITMTVTNCKLILTGNTQISFAGDNSNATKGPLNVYTSISSIIYSGAEVSNVTIGPDVHMTLIAGDGYDATTALAIYQQSKLTLKDMILEITGDLYCPYPPIIIDGNVTWKGGPVTGFNAITLSQTRLQLQPSATLTLDNIVLYHQPSL